MRVMAVDYGDTRTGLAVSDATGTIAGEAWVVKERVMSALARMIAEESSARGVSVIVVGHPKNMDGSCGTRAEKSERLADILRRDSKPEIVLWDERLTSVSAHKMLFDAGFDGKRRKNVVDAVAATLILEGYLRSKQ